MASDAKQQDARQIALQALLHIDREIFSDAALDRSLSQATLDSRDRRFVTELVYGVTRRRRTLDALVDQLSRKRSRHPVKLQSILRLGLYQLRYLSQVPASAAVNTSVELAKRNGLRGLAGLVNGMLRQYTRLQTQGDPLVLPDEPIAQLGLRHSYPDWIVALWVDAVGLDEAEQLCHWFNQPPSLDLRVNPIRTTRSEVADALEATDIEYEMLPLPQALQLAAQPVKSIPGFDEGWWSIQDSSAQLVGHCLDPQPGETIVDACAAPGGKATHAAELMGDRGVVWACDRSAQRLERLQENQTRLGLTSLQTKAADLRELAFDAVDRVLLDVPCSGLGTLHRHADARWRQTPETVAGLVTLQQELLSHAAGWVKPGGMLVYATCTLHPQENEGIVRQFLANHSDWSINPIDLPDIAPEQLSSWRFSGSGSDEPSLNGCLKIWPHRHNMDGFFVARLRRAASPMEV
ncbi:MAG: 16S rRNA (cytosine(967)-C(5))-methyltransferase [Elainellaceae cyanobacterium]